MGVMVKERRILYTVFAIIFLTRLIKISNPPLDYSSWRQVDTDSIARNFVEYRFNILYPQLNYDGPMPNYVQLEFQITTFIIAILYKLFGYHVFLGRIVPVAFFMGSCCYLYMLVKRKSGVYCGIITVFLYGMLPINIVYSRNIMPESSMMFFMLGALYYFILWIDEGRNRDYILSTAFTTLTVLTKLPSAMIGIPMIYMVFARYGRKAFKNTCLYIFPVIVFGTAFIYFNWLGTIAEQKFVSGIGTSMILPNIFNPSLNGDTAKYLSEQFAGKVFTVPGTIFFSIGAVTKKTREELVYYAWLAAGALHILLVDSAIHLDYYLMFITPVISIFMGCAVASILKRESNYCNKHSMENDGRMQICGRYRYFLLISLIILLLHDMVFLKDAYKLQYDYLRIGEHVQSQTDKNDLIIIGSDSPELLYTSGRKGWRLYGDKLTADNIRELSKEGAMYFVPLSPNMNRELMHYLDMNYEKVVFTDGSFMYKLGDDNIISE